MTDENVKSVFERLKNIQDEKNKVPETYLTLNHYQLEELERIINENYIHKDKIREKIKEVDKLYDNAETDEFGIKNFYGYDFIMDMLQELLGDEK